MLYPFALKKPIGPSYALDEQDVLSTKQKLGQLGYYKPLVHPLGRPLGRKGQRAEITPWPDTPLFEGLKRFQKDNDLKADGLMKPGGPTEKMLGDVLGRTKLLALADDGQGRRTAAEPTKLNQQRKPQRKPGALVQETVPANDKGKPQGMTPPIPKEKRELFRGREQDWDNFYNEAEKRKDISPTERGVYMDIFANEGGLMKNKKTVAGITAETLNDLIEKKHVTDIPSGSLSADLSTAQRISAYKGYLDYKLGTIGGSKALNRIDNDKAARGFGDMVFRHGGKGAAKIIQVAANRMVPGTLETDGRMGPKTFSAYKALVENPKTRERFLNIVADERWKAAQKVPNHGLGDKARTDRYRP